MDFEDFVFGAIIVFFMAVLIALAVTPSNKPTCDQGFVMVKGMCVQGYDPRKPR